jgi:phospholipid/cholesterol/gamma-HCH transport system ATP-binding protein
MQKAGNSTGEVLVEVQHLQTKLHGQVLHQDINLQLREGEILGLVGASGSGKSVLLRVLIGLLRPDGGSVKIFGEDLYGAGEEERRQIARGWGVVFQENALFSTLTVAENVILVLQEQLGLPEQLAQELAAVKIQMAGLPTDAADLYPAQLSGGMRKRAAIARAIAADPQLLLFDEPTTGLDPVTAGRLDELILLLRKALHPAILVITHDLDTLFGICDRVVVLADKTIVADGPPSQVARGSHPWIKQYFQGERGRAALESAAATTPQ